MKVGDLVRFHDRFGVEDTDHGVGLVTGVEPWTDKGAPDRNFGVNIYVLWPGGIRGTYEEIDLEVISESR